MADGRHTHAQKMAVWGGEGGSADKWGRGEKATPFLPMAEKAGGRTQKRQQMDTGVGEGKQGKMTNEWIAMRPGQ